MIIDELFNTKEGFQEHELLSALNCIDTNDNQEFDDVCVEDNEYVPNYQLNIDVTFPTVCVGYIDTVYDRFGKNSFGATYLVPKSRFDQVK